MSWETLLKIFVRKTRSALIRLHGALRTFFWRIVLRVWQPSLRLGKGVFIGRNVRFRIYNGGSISVGERTGLEDNVLLHVEGGKISIGNDGFIGWGCQVVSFQEVRIGDDALIAAYCVVRDFEHGTAPNGIPMRKQPPTVAPIEIGDDVWLGAHVTVTAGCKIGSGAVVGANGVVTKDIAANTIAAGVPAKEIRSR